MRKLLQQLPLIIVIALAGLVVLWGCGDSPSTAVDLVGSIEVIGYLPNDSLAEFIDITLDDQPLGIFANPHTLTDILAGMHKLGVVTWDTLPSDSIEEYSRTEYVTIEPGQVTTAEIFLVADGPYEGNPAPDFTLYDLDSNLVALSDFTGEIVLLYFFVST